MLQVQAERKEMCGLQVLQDVELLQSGCDGNM